MVTRIDLGHPQVPAHEQWVGVGGALSNCLTAVHLLGFGGKMLSGAKVRDADIAAACCDSGETLLGWIALGTPITPASGHTRQGGVEVVLAAWCGP